MTNRIAKAKVLLVRTMQIQGGFTKRMEIISTLILATGIYGAEGASIDRTALQALDTAAVNAMWGERQGTRAKDSVSSSQAIGCPRQ